MLFFMKKDTLQNTDKFAVLYEKYRFLMMRVALNILHDRFLAEDAVQDAFIHTARNMDKIDDVDARETKRYLIVLTKNASIDIYRKRSALMEKEVFIDELEYYEEPSSGLESDMENEVLDVLKNLPVKYRDVFLLKYSSRMENKEIAGLLGISETAVRQRIARGKLLVQKALDELEVLGNEACECNG